MENNISILNQHFTDKFIAIVPIPLCLRDINVTGNRFISLNQVDVNTVQFNIQRFTLPSINIPAITVKYDGQSMKVSSHTRTPYEPIVLTVKIDSKMSNYWFFKNWMDCMNHTKSGDMAHTNAPKYENFSYTSDMSLIIMDEYNNQLVQFDFTKAFPVNVSGIRYDYTDKGSFIASDITFEFSQYLMTPIEQGDFPSMELIDNIII